ncbi:MAG TPA: YdeI/OmpD-associated family protein [Vicinamibacterales bacterium]|nr:YdeI/OmpD-associated family protein [Vicinamibacterales bacterium]
MSTRDPRIDAYIANARADAQPLLKEIRAAVHAGCPDVSETLKWRTPTFEHKGIMLGMAAFKSYTTMGFWKSKLMRQRLSASDQKALEQAGQVKVGEALPPRPALVRLVKVAAALNEEGVVQPRVMRKKAPLKTPAYLTAALRKNPVALARFTAFPPSHRREYIEWIVDAKQEATRERRMAQAIEWIADGKARNWKYER